MQKFYLLLLVLIIALSYLLSKQILLQDPLLPNNHDPIEYMKGLRMYHYDLNGILKNYASANSWQFSTRYNLSILQHPTITVFKDPNIYKIKANSGQIQHKKLVSNLEEIIKLFSQVNIEQKYLYEPKKSGFNLTTDYLEFNPNTESATTSKKVTIYKPGLIITGTGMEANLKTNQIELKEHVTTEYYSNHISNQHNE